MKLLNRFFPRQKVHIGIDMGSGSIKIVELAMLAGRPALYVMASAPIPAGIFREGIVNDKEILAGIIHDLLTKNGVSTSFCVSGVDGQHIFNRFVSFPVMTKAELLEAIKWDAEKYIPYMPDDCYLDAVILEHATDGKEMKVLLVASAKEVIDSRVDTLLKADLIPVGIDFGALALGRAFMQTNRGAGAVFDIGACSTKLTFYKKAAIAFSRTMTFGGNCITKLLQDQLRLNWEEAERFKLRQKGLLISSDEDTEALIQVRSLIRLSINDMKREIQRSLEYYQLQNADEPLEKIMFTGGGSLVPGLKEALITDLDLQMIQADLSDLTDYGPGFEKKYVQSVSPLFGTAFGLALWEETTL